jgi:hypothetical protein
MQVAMFRSAKGTDVHRQTGKEHVCPFGGAPDTAPVLHEFLKSAKGTGARRETMQ